MMNGADRFGRRLAVGFGAVALAAVGARPAFAQLDPLLFIKRVPPTVIIVVDTSMRMLEDGNGGYYDPNTYTTASDPAAAAAIGIDTATASTYRRIYHNLTYENVQDANTKFEATDITGVPNNSQTYATFWNATRLEIAKSGVKQAVSENPSAVSRWGLVKLRQSNPAWRVSPNCDKPVRITADANLQVVNDTSPCNVGGSGKYAIYVPTVTVNQPNYSLEATGDAVVVSPATTAADSDAIVTKVSRAINDSQGLIPAGTGARAYSDRPLTHALDDARALAISTMSADLSICRDCRNTVVVLIAGGKDDGDSTYLTNHSVTATASTFLNVSVNAVNHRVPIYVAGIKPDPTHEPELQTIAANSGGRYFNVSDAAGVVQVINLAVHSAYARAADFNTGAASEFQGVSPIVGTVNLKGASNATGGPLPNTDITANGVPIPQRSNMIVTAGFRLNGTNLYGAEGAIRAFRTYRPEVDGTKPSGYKFVADGTRLWPDRDGRPETAGLARAPADPNQRNIYTYIPGTGMVKFDLTNVATIAPHLGGADGNVLIPFVRSLPIGAVIGSTPALMDAPSLDPPPDPQYGRADGVGTFAGDHKDRRSMIWVGANDGMIHGFDARTGFEVWAFIPYNLLPKLRTLLDGQPMDTFDYFVDSSPKVAEVKIDGAWKSVLIIGQGNGGTFYQTFDVTEAGMGGPVPDSDDYAGVLATFANASRVPFMWSFPRYDQFDTTYFGSFNVGNSAALDSATFIDATPGGWVNLYGDLKSTATSAEKSVGFTWSDPAVGPLNEDRSTTAVVAGSGYFPPIENQLPGRGFGSPRAGRFLYLLDVKTGLLLGGATSCGGSGSVGCVDVGVVSNPRKNAIQADPTAGGVDADSRVMTKAYVGDVDGRYWRFNFTALGAITFTLMTNTSQPIYNSSALLYVGTSDQYMFFSTGSDLLPPSSDGGTGTFKLYGLKDNYPGGGATVNFSRNLSAVSVTANGYTTGERGSTSPSVAGDIVFFTTIVEDGAAPCNNVTSQLYGLTFLGGAAYDTNGSGSVTANESPIISTVAGRATAPFIVDQHLYFGTTGATGSNLEVFGDDEDFNNGVGQVGVRLLSWRELR